MAILSGGAILKRMQRSAMGLEKKVVNDQSKTENAFESDGSALFDYTGVLGDVFEIRKFKKDLTYNIHNFFMTSEEYEQYKEREAQRVPVLCMQPTPMFAVVDDACLSQMIAGKKSIFSYNNEIVLHVLLQLPIVCYFSLLSVVARNIKKKRYKNALIAGTILLGVIGILMFLSFSGVMVSWWIMSHMMHMNMNGIISFISS